MRSDSTPIEYVLRCAEEQSVRFVRLWFVDVLGLLKSSSIPISELEQALVEGVGLDGSSLESGMRLFELDAIAHPDPTTFELLPWRPDAAVARMFCDVKLPDGTPSRVTRVRRCAASSGTSQSSATHFRSARRSSSSSSRASLAASRRRRSTTARTSIRPPSMTAATSVAP